MALELTVLFIKENRPHTFNGIFFTCLFALASYYLAGLPAIQWLGLSPLVLALVLGMIYGGTLRPHMPHEWAPGIQFIAKYGLRLAIVLFGFRLTFQAVALIGVNGFILNLLIIVLVLSVGTFLGMKVFKLDRDTSLLISSGAAICGAAAVLATESVIKSEPYKAALALISVVLFGTIAMFLYPFLQHMDFFGFNQSQYGVYVGATIHELAQALVAGTQISPVAADAAIITKMSRVLMLAPTLIIVSFILTRLNKHRQTQRTAFSQTVPWFAVYFIGMVGFNSLQLLPTSVTVAINQFDSFLMTLSMAALGIETNLGKIKHIGLKPLYLALLLFILLMGGGYLLTSALIG